MFPTIFKNLSCVPTGAQPLGPNAHGSEVELMYKSHRKCNAHESSPKLHIPVQGKTVFRNQSLVSERLGLLL